MQPYTCEEGFPTRDGVCADDGVVGREFEVDIEGGAAGGGDGVFSGFAGGFEDGLGAVCCEGFEEALVWLG